MATFGEPWQPILDTLAALPAAWPSPEWTWDSRLECVTSLLAVALVPTARAALDAVVPATWTSVTIATAPDTVRALSERCGGLWPGQLLLSGDVVAGMFLFALWWPWGDGSRVSVRLGIANPPRPKELSPLVRALFEIS